MIKLGKVGQGYCRFAQHDGRRTTATIAGTCHHRIGGKRLLRRRHACKRSGLLMLILLWCGICTGQSKRCWGFKNVVHGSRRAKMVHVWQAVIAAKRRRNILIAGRAGSNLVIRRSIRTTIAAHTKQITRLTANLRQRGFSSKQWSRHSTTIHV